METRVAKLEAASEHLVREVGALRADLNREVGALRADIAELRRDARSDFRLSFGALIAVALGLAGLMAKGFHWL